MKIEKVTTADAAELLAVYAPYVQETAITFEYDVPTLEEFESRIRTISARLPYLKAVGEDGKILGYAYAGSFYARRAYDWSVETTVYIRRDCRRNGLGRALYTGLEASLRDIGILNMNACIAMPKAEDHHLKMDSIYFHRQMGFTEVGVFHDSGFKFDTWYNMIWMEKMIGNHTDSQHPVRFGQWRVIE